MKISYYLRVPHGNHFIFRWPWRHARTLSRAAGHHGPRYCYLSSYLRGPSTFSDLLPRVLLKALPGKLNVTRSGQAPLECPQHHRNPTRLHPPFHPVQSVDSQTHLPACILPTLAARFMLAPTLSDHRWRDPSGPQSSGNHSREVHPYSCTP